MLISFGVIAFLTGVSTLFSWYQLTTLTQPLEEEIPQSIENIKQASTLDVLAQQIRYYDEVLTQSARNFAFTQDSRWEEQYNNTVPLLDTTIEVAMTDGDDTDRTFFSSVENANLILVDLEAQSFNLIKNGSSSEAIAILESEEYWKHKKTYSTALEGYLKQRGKEREKTITGSTQILSQSATKAADTVLTTTLLLSIMSLIIFSLALFFGITFARDVSRSIKELSVTAKNIAQGDFSKQAIVYGDDEISGLARTFNDMAHELKTSRMKLENQTTELKDRIEDMEKFNRLTINREVKMDELKKEIAELKKKL